jgi:predicted DNA-binding ribbon-helix-helix protein
MVSKRSVTLRGHATSVSLEDEFWTELKRMASVEGIALGELIERVDGSRGAANLSSALRLTVLRHLRKAAGVRTAISEP